jgi:hypothetical protein
LRHHAAHSRRQLFGIRFLQARDELQRVVIAWRLLPTRGHSERDSDRRLAGLLARRVSGGPVPVLVSQASWNPAADGLHESLAAQLAADRPALTAATPACPGDGSWTEALLAAGLIVPILDGLDEIPGAVRAQAITRINDALRPGEPLVVTCRAGPHTWPPCRRRMAPR